jgi:hypothetical protein
MSRAPGRYRAKNGRFASAIAENKIVIIGERRTGKSTFIARLLSEACGGSESIWEARKNMLMSNASFVKVANGNLVDSNSRSNPTDGVCATGYFPTIEPVLYKVGGFIAVDSPPLPRKEHLDAIQGATSVIVVSHGLGGGVEKCSQELLQILAVVEESIVFARQNGKSSRPSVICISAKDLMVISSPLDFCVKALTDPISLDRFSIKGQISFTSSEFSSSYSGELIPLAELIEKHLEIENPKTEK